MPEAKCGTVISMMEDIAPKRLAEDWDNVGLIIGDGSKPVRKIMVCLDFPKWVLDEALSIGADMVITHHPLIFSGIKAVNTDSALGRMIIKLIKNDISVYSSHTNFDIAKNGLNDIFARRLGFDSFSIIQPLNMGNESEALGIGRLGEMNERIPLETYAKSVKKILGLSSVRYAGNPDCQVKRVALINGSGGRYIKQAKAAGADVLVTGDMGYHQILDALESGLSVIDAGHYGTEIMMIDAVADYLKASLVRLGYGTEVLRSKTNINPIIEI